MSQSVHRLQVSFRLSSFIYEDVQVCALSAALLWSYYVKRCCFGTWLRLQAVVLRALWTRAMSSALVIPPGLPPTKVVATGVRARWQEWNGREYMVGELCQPKGQMGTNFPHCIIPSYLVLVIFGFYVIVSGVSSNRVGALCDSDCWRELADFTSVVVSCCGVWMTTSEMRANICRQHFLLLGVPVVFDKFYNNFGVRALVFSTFYLLREGWVSSCFLDYEMSSVTNCCVVDTHWFFVVVFS